MESKAKQTDEKEVMMQFNCLMNEERKFNGVSHGNEGSVHASSLKKQEETFVWF